MASNYILRVTAGPGYDLKDHQVVNVNTEKHSTIDTELCTADINVRVKDYRGLPHGSPANSPYFESHPKDTYAITFAFTPKKAINGNDLVFGNDFDHPIRDRLPPGFGVAMKFIKWAVDPGLDGDVYADEPYLYGPLGSSANTLHVGSKSKEPGTAEHDYITKGVGLEIEEGGTEDGIAAREEKSVPELEAGRKKWFITEDNRKQWEWEAGRTYGFDFFNGFLDFNEFALKLPVITIPIMRYWDGQGLRYVLKNRLTNEVLFVVLFTLYLKEDVDETGHVKEGVEGGLPFDKMGEERKTAHDEARKYLDTEDDSVD